MAMSHLEILTILVTLICLSWARPDTSDSVEISASQSGETIILPNPFAQPPSVAIAHVPAQVGTAISEMVHYAETPVVSGYTSALHKADLSAFDTPFKFNINQRYYRPIKTIVPKVMVNPAAAVLPVPPQVRTAPAATAVELHPPILPEVRISEPFYYSPLINSLIR